MNHYKLYHNQIPDFILAAANAPEMLRLRDVGMNCGCEYTAFPRFQRLAPYSRWDHSLGVALMVWHFTEDPAQALSGLFHDIATPVFAHVVDFLRGDYLTQESTEDGTRERIAQSSALCDVINGLQLTVDDVCDYHRYPIADNDTPRLSADRLEYTLGNCLNYHIREAGAVQRFYQDLVVWHNEDGIPELTFQTMKIAEDFTCAALACSEIYAADADRFAMQTLSELLSYAMQTAVLKEDDLYETEAAVIQKLLSDTDTAARWLHFRSLRSMKRADTPPGAAWRRVPAKKRYIDPLVKDKGRVSLLSPEIAASLEAFRGRDLGYWILGTV